MATVKSAPSASIAVIGSSLAAIAVIHLGYSLCLNQRKPKKDEPTVQVSLPQWAIEYEQSLQSAQDFQSDQERIRVAIELSHRNVQNQTGGPFGCAIFERSKKDGTCRLFSVGVNRVVPLCNSTLHAEMVAIQYAQKKLRSFSMKQAGDTSSAESSDADGKEYLLYTSCEPCAMCLGGTLWSGVSELVCAATKDDAEAIGFNEGPVFDESYKQLEAAGVKVKRRVLRNEGAAVLQEYGKVGKIYNAS